MNDEFVNHEEMDPELIETGFIDEETEFPSHINVPISYFNMNRIFGICKQCNRSNTYINWCQICNSKRFQRQHEGDKKWSSGIKMIDQFILDTQESANRPSQMIEWIPYER